MADHTEIGTGGVSVDGDAGAAFSFAPVQVASAVEVVWDFDGDGDVAVVPNPTQLPSHVDLARWWSAEDFTSTSQQTLVDRASGGVLTRGTGSPSANDPTIILSSATPGLLDPDGVDDYADSDYTATFTPTTGAHTIIVVGQWDAIDTADAFNRIVSSESGPGNVGLQIQTDGASDARVETTIGGATTFVNIPPPAPADSLADGDYFMAATVVDSGSANTYQNGHGFGSTTSITGVGAITHNPYRLYARGYVLSSFGASATRHLIVFDRALGVAELDTIADLLLPADTGVEDITSYVSSMSSSIGRDFQAQYRGRVTPGRLRLNIDDPDSHFNRWNPESPFRAAGLSLDTGHLIRVRVAGAAENNATLLARDRFEGTAGTPLTVDELGNTWTNQQDAVSTLTGDNAVIADSTQGATRSSSTVDVGVSDFYAQVNIKTYPGSTNSSGIIYRFVDIDNHGLVFLTDSATTSVVKHIVRSGGVDTTHTEAAVDSDTNITIGAHISGSSVTVLANGVELFTDVGDAAGTTETLVGMHAFNSVDPDPELSNFFVWDDLAPASDTTSIFTGYIASVDPVIDGDQAHTAVVKANGRFARMSNVRVDSPRSPGPHTSPGSESDWVGRTASDAIGNVLNKAGELLPPASGAIETETTILGSIPDANTRAITQIRNVEDTSLGVTWEDEGGRMRYTKAANVGTGTSVGDWSDLGTYPHNFETPIDVTTTSSDVINRVTGGLTPIVPSIKNVFGTEVSNAAAVQTNVTLPIPNAAPHADDGEPGDLFIAILSSSVREDGQLWNEPPGWKLLHSAADQFGIRVYAKVLTASDMGTNFVLYDDVSSVGGAAAAYMYHIAVGTWHGDILTGVQANVDGVGLPNSAADARNGDNDPPAVLLDPAVPQLAIAARVGMVASTGAAVAPESADEADAPEGFESLITNLVAGTGTTNFDVAAQTASRKIVDSVINPTPFTSQMDNFDYIDTTTITVAGFDGDPPGSGRTTTYDDLDSQRDRDAVVTHPSPGLLHANQTDLDAYGLTVLAASTADNPVLIVTFTANKSAGDRAQALNRLFEVITVKFAGRSGMGITSDYVIDGIEHRWSDGTTRWQTLWLLTPTV